MLASPLRHDDPTDARLFSVEERDGKTADGGHIKQVTHTEHFSSQAGITL